MITFTTLNTLATSFARYMALAVIAFSMLTGFASTASAATRTVSCAGDISSALQSAVNSSVNGDTVQIGAGSCTANSRVNVNDKNISIIGAGQGVTNITTGGSFLYMGTSGTNNPNWRISGFSLSGSGTSVVVIQVWADGSPTIRGPFRIDHLDLNYPNNGADGMIQVWGSAYGLIDHNNLTQAYEAFILTSMSISGDVCSYNYAWQGGTCSLSTLSGGATLSLPYEPGGYRNIYIEDNTFTGLNTNPAFATDTGYAGGRIVFRHNTLTNSGLYAHWTSSGSVNHLWWEVYNNKFTWNLANTGIYPMRMQGGGTGLIYNNTISGYPGNYILLGEGRLPDQAQSGTPLGLCDGTHNWDGNMGDSAAPGWPCLSQTGRDAGKSIAQIQAGQKQASFPMYLWNNGAQDKCFNPGAAGSSCDNSFSVGIYNTSGPNYFKSTPHPNGDVDYSITASKPAGAGTHTLNYTAFLYPYPLTANGMPNPTGSGTPPDTTVPSVPTALSGTAVSQSQINLTWTDSTDNVGVTGYKVFRDGTQVGTTATASYSDTGLTAATAYSYTVSAYDAAGNNSSQSSSISVTTQAGAPAPVVTITASPTSVVSGGSSTLTWSTTSATSCTASGGWSGSKAVSGSQILTGLTSTATYTLACTGTGGTDTRSATITVTAVPDTTAPSTPTGLSGTVISSTQINLAWTPSTDNVAVTGYKIFRNGTQVGTSATANYSDTGLTAATTYTYTISAYDAAGNNSVQSTSVSATTATQASNPSPTFINEYETVWNTFTTPKTTTSFNVQAGDVLVAYAMTEDTPVTVSISGGSLVWTQLQAVNVSGYGRAYMWTSTVDTNKTMSVAFTGGGNPGNYGGNVLHFRNASIGASTKTNVASGAPTLNLTTTQANSAIVVANDDWTALSGTSRIWRTNAGAINETSYLALASRYSIYGGFHPNAGAIGTYAVGLSAPGAQKYSIIAVEVKGQTAVTPPPPSAATASLTAAPTSITSGQSSTLTWSSTNATSCTGTGFTASAISGSVSVSPTVTTTYSITCTGPGGTSPATSATVTVTAPVDTTAPSVPTGVSGTAFSTSQIDLTWTPSTDDVGVTGYKIFRDGTQVGTSASASYSDTGLTAATAYAYTVSAYDAAGNTSAPSAGVNVTTSIVHAPAASFTANPTVITSGQSSTLTWKSYYSNGCTGTNFSTGGAINGSAVVTPDVTTTYTLVCTGTSGGTVTVRAVVTVSGTTAFVINDRVQTTVNLKVRATPSTSGTALGTQAKGSFGVVVGGPTVANGYTWWNINYDTGVDGWSVQDYLTKVGSTGDTVPPSIPTGVSAAVVSSTQINLTWTASTDNVGVTGYKVFRDGTQVGTTATASYNDTGLTAATAYSYTVSAYDAAGNNSAPSTAVSATTLTATATFTIGDRMVTTANLNVRGTPSTSGTLLGTQPLGSLGVLVGGPTIANGYIWWNINYDTGVDGWSVQDYIAKTTSIPTASLSANPTSITSGQSSTLTWSSTNATSCTGTGFTASAISGSVSVSPTVTTTYSITCTGPGGTSPAASATVTVSSIGGSTCPKGTTYADGCASAPAGAPTSPNLFSGYATRPPWNVAGVDYRVGCSLSVCTGAPAGSPVGKNPRTTLPTGATLSGNTIIISGNNVTLDSYDFCSGNVGIVINQNVTGTVITNSYFCPNAGEVNSSAIAICTGGVSNCNTGGSSTSGLTLRYNEVTGKMPAISSSLPSGVPFLETWYLYLAEGPFTLEYNYCHNMQISCGRIAPSTATQAPYITKRFNMSRDYGFYSSGEHVEETFWWPGSSVNSADMGYNTDVFTGTFGTANWSIGDPQTPTGTVLNGFNMHNNVLMGGPSFNVYFGTGLGDPIATTGSQFNNNYLDPKGYGPYYPSYQQRSGGVNAFAGTSWLSSFSGNINLATGTPCGTTYFNSGNNTTAVGDGGSC